jgi:indole-3-glycerol phosphate synthase
VTEAVSRPADLLATIVAATRRIVSVRASNISLDALQARAAGVNRERGRFFNALSLARVNVVAECKRRSPSKGVLRDHYDPASIAVGYAGAGAAAVSVLTEPTFFDGSLDHLRSVRAAVDVPILRKDFIVSEYQIAEARLAGADAVLLIVAALTAGELSRLSACAAENGLDALVEVHDDAELDAALAAGARLVGVNNRNLRTLNVDLPASERLIARMPSDIVAVSESGLRTADDLRRLRGMGYRAFLIGERFMTQPDPGEALGRLLTEAGREAPATADQHQARSW